MTDNFVRVARVQDVPVGRSKRVFLGDEELALWHTKDRWFAVNNVCSHQHIAALHEGILEGERVRCPMHGWTYALATGREIAGNGRIRTYEVRLVEGDVFVGPSPAPEMGGMP